jgi:hypothetical protein
MLRVGITSCKLLQAKATLGFTTCASMLQVLLGTSDGAWRPRVQVRIWVWVYQGFAKSEP